MNVVVLILCVLLCLVNAALWTLYTGMPVMGAAWVGAAVVALWLRNWSVNVSMTSRPKRA
jgi:hypothetical protein